MILCVSVCLSSLSVCLFRLSVFVRPFVGLSVFLPVGLLLLCLFVCLFVGLFNLLGVFVWLACLSLCLRYFLVSLFVRLRSWVVHLARRPSSARASFARGKRFSREAMKPFEFARVNL